jgi:hypothetical protein
MNSTLISLFLSSLLICNASLYSSQFTFDIDYKESAAIFDTMDHVSLWKEGFCNPQYRSFWDTHIGPLPHDAEHFQRYTALREKYFFYTAEPDVLKGDGLFNTISSLHQDPIADAFYSAATVDEAFIKLQTIIEPEEIKTLRTFYKHFECRYSSLLCDTQNFMQQVDNEKTRILVPQVLHYLEQVARFYRVTEHISFRVRHSWFPPIRSTGGHCSGINLIIQSHPQLHGIKEQSSIILHEVIHAISRVQTQEQKVSLTRAFLETAPKELPKARFSILEEPFAVVFGQMLFLELFDKPSFEETMLKKTWYANPWIDSYARAIYDTVKKAFLAGDVLNDILMKQLGQIAGKVQAS